MALGQLNLRWTYVGDNCRQSLQWAGMVSRQIVPNFVFTKQAREVRAAHCEREDVRAVGLFDCLQVLNNAVGVFAQQRVRRVGIGLVLACN